EGVELRKNNIAVPIMVMNASEEAFEIIAQYNLEPVVYSLPILKSLVDFVQSAPLNIHLEVETGMNRLGLSAEDLTDAIDMIRSCPQLVVASVFSHLAGADEKQHDDYSREQADRFNQAYQKISSGLNQNPIRHLLNSPGILRLSDHQMDMVRLGIGLYGIDPTAEINDQLKSVVTLKSVISQVKHLKPGETVGYGRWGKANQAMTIATIAIGYADGFSRSFSKGVGKVWVGGQRAPVIGNVCMDMTMIDITGIEAREGDEVIIFGEQLSVQEVAASIKTIPYEILTSTSERVKRVFYTESI
ncbi:MAG TPA: alanine racemase, partial [Candidatus Berkiella sp.]|nr:alanine racemase [Candidatus Berkiella sp.]